MDRRQKHWIPFSLSLLVVFFGILSLRPVPSLTPENAQVIEGTILKITKAGTKDVVIKLKETNQVFYINRGLEKKLELNQLQSDLIGKWVTITFPKYWTPLDAQNKWRHISVLKSEENLIYSEL